MMNLQIMTIVTSTISLVVGFVALFLHFTNRKQQKNPCKFNTILSYFSRQCLANGNNFSGHDHGLLSYLLSASRN